MDLLTDITQLSPPLALALALSFVGFGLKRSPVADWLIPWILIAAGAALYPLISEVGKISYTVSHPEAFAAVIGACIGGFAVGGHQAIKQMLNELKLRNETKFIKKDENENAKNDEPKS